MITPRPKIHNLETRWKIAIECNRFLYDLDHAKHYPGGKSLGFDVKIIYNDRTKYNWHPTPKDLNYQISHIEWCIENCNGNFFRLRDTEIWQAILDKHADDPYFNLDNIMNYTCYAPINIMTFSDPDDAVRFKFALDYI